MIRSARSLLTTAAVVLAALAARAGEPARDRAAAAAAEFENRVRPLLVEHCFRCHGARKQESNLRLDSRAAIMQGGDSGPAVVPGRPGESLLVKAVRREGDLQMPPDSRLGADQVATLARWVADGVPWPAEAAASGAAIRRGAITAEERAFWSLQPVRNLPPPDVQDRGWIQTSLDPWILARLEARGMHPAPAADRRTLIRRATFDLTGLPPTPGDVDAFVADRSPDAFSRVVDRLLASPAYGERWGRHWLDVVRYADTAGETADYPVREAYRYRDYVIDAFNRDLPYDQFVREQVAGDILASGKDGAEYARMVTATGFIAVSRRFGFDSENYHYLTIQDTIDTTGQAFLGLTLGCARCHDHKYDPVTAKDYYALYGIFDSTLYPFAGAEQKPATRSFASRLPRREAEALRIEIARNGGAPGPTIATLDGMDGDFEIQKPAAGGSKGSLVSPWLAEDGPDVIGDAQSPFTNLTGRKGGSGVRFPADARDHRAWQHIWPARRAADGELIHVNLDFRVVGNATGPAAYRFALAHGAGGPSAVEVVFGSNGVAASDGEKPRPIGTVRPGTWYNLRLAIDLKRRTYSGAIGTPGDLVSFDGRRVAAGWDGTLDTVVIDGRGPAAGSRPALDVDNIAVRQTPIPAPGTDSPAPTDRARRLAELVARRNDSLAYAVAEGTPENARLQRRGEPTKPGEVVPRRFLEILGGDAVPRDAEGSGRRELAEWLVRPSNPLAARVMVNRIWSGHFGVGLVATENDFGRRGSRPSHPELLDHLAARFVASGWSVKAMHRLIMLSATYQQSSEPTAASSAVGADPDPTNALLGHFPRRRLDAESIRDAILMLGGGLDRSPGGPHPFPPVGTTFTQHAPFSAVYPSRRRSVYLMTQRIRRHPYLALFDGPDPNASTPHRSDTTVPTQALFFLNDPFVHEQAEGLARRVLAARSDDAERIRLAFAMTLARGPTDDEIASASRFVARYQTRLAVDGSPADERERRSWSALARTLFARNEFVFVD